MSIDLNVLAQEYAGRCGWTNTQGFQVVHADDLVKAFLTFAKEINETAEQPVSVKNCTEAWCPLKGIEVKPNDQPVGCREAFEAWFEREHEPITESMRGDDGCYINDCEAGCYIGYYWEAWQARVPVRESGKQTMKGQNMKLTEEQIKHMVNRFLYWKLPKDFHPDCGIHFDAEAAKKLNPNNGTYEPNGTNLFHVGQAEEMVRFMLEGLP